MTSSQNGTNTPKKVAIIIVSFNRSDVTNLALDSIAKAKCEIPYHVYLIDNQSLSDEFAKMKDVFEFLVDTKKFEGTLIRNSKNLGYAAGNNVGIRLALADPKISHICLLNNDTIVSDGWLDGLVQYSDGSLVGPVSNEVGNEQVIAVDYKLHGPDGYNRDRVREFADGWNKTHIGNVVPIDSMLGFFCVLGSRELFEKVGLLDEAFGMGYYEDDDFCLRCKQAGFSMKLVREIFVHHWGSASFNAVGENFKNDLMQRNRKLFEKKHSIEWEPHKNRWAASLAHEINWANQKYSGETLTCSIDKITFSWIQNVYSEAFEKCSRPTFVPAGVPFLQYVRNGFMIRISNALKPGLLRSTILFLTSLLFSRSADRKYLFRVNAIQFARKYFKELIALRAKFRNFDLHYRAKNINRVFVFAPVQSYWGRRQRPQHIADNLAKTNNLVFWIEPEIGFQNLEGESPFLSLQRGDNRNLIFLRSRGFSYFNFYVSSWPESEAKKYLDLLKNKLEKYNIDLKNVTLVAQCPFWYSIAKIFPGKVVFECMDAHDSFGSCTSEVLMLEDALCEKSNSIVVTSPYLLEKLRKKTLRPLYLIRNGCEPAHFISQGEQSRHSSSPSQMTVGYFGAVAEWFDCQLLAKVAKLNPEICFEIIGNTTYSDAVKELAALPNVKLLGEQPYSELPKLTKHWKAGLIPFRITELILATNPVKMYEYSALGLPVVATPIPEVIEASIRTYIGENAEDFSKAILQAIQDHSIEVKEKRRSFAEQNSWMDRASKMLNVISAAETHMNGPVEAVKVSK